MPAATGRNTGKLLAADAGKCTDRGGNYSPYLGAIILPPIFSHVPLATYFHSVGSLSVLAPCPAHACFAVPQSFWPALATPKHFSVPSFCCTGCADTSVASPRATMPATAAWILD